MIFNNIPLELFEIAASFKDSDFRPADIWLLDTQEFQLWVPLKSEEDVGIYVRFRNGVNPTYKFHDCNYSHTSDFDKWVNRDETISKFCDWYLEVFGYQHYEIPENYLDL